MPYYDVANLVTVTKMNMIRRNALWLCKNHCCENMTSSLPQSCTAVSAAPDVSCRAVWQSQLLSKSSADLRRGLRSSKISLFYQSYLVASWMHLHNCRCFQEHLRMLLQSPRALCLAPGRSGSIWKYLEALVRSAGVSGRIACCFRTDLHFADVLEYGDISTNVPQIKFGSSMCKVQEKPIWKWWYKCSSLKWW